MTAPSTLAEPSVLKACCADLWSHPGVRLLTGPTLRPGGLDLTRSGLSRLGLDRGTPVLDVGCGAGATLAELREQGLDAVGVDLSPTLVSEARASGRALAADAESLPFADGAFTGVVMECVLSAMPDKDRTVREIVRVLRPGGGLLLSDVVVGSPLAPPLDSFAGWIACAAGALPLIGYLDLLGSSGLRVEAHEAHPEALASLLAQARRRLALVQGALQVGLVDASPGGLPVELVELGQQMVARAIAEVERGTLGYALFLARRP